MCAWIQSVAAKEGGHVRKGIIADSEPLAFLACFQRICYTILATINVNKIVGTLG